MQGEPLDEGEPDEDLDDDLQDGDEEAHTALPGVALGRVTFPCGSTIASYADGRFEAVCRVASHNETCRCRLTRTWYGSEDSEAQGRPLGLMAAWIIHAGEHNSAASHCELFSLFVLDHGIRTRARDQLATMPGAEALLSQERKPRAGEGDEPEDWAGC